MKMFKKIFFKSKWIHKWFGLPLILFMMWMSISGIILNHPEMISRISVPGWLLPKQYQPENWNRSSLISLVFSEKNPSVLYAAGKQGVWRSTDGGYNFERFDKGFETSDYYKKTKHLFLTVGKIPTLLAATDGGLYVNNLANGQWKNLPLGDTREAVRKILPVKGDLMVFTESNVYINKGNDFDFGFKKVNWSRFEPEQRVTLVDLFFHLHDGRVWGFPGKLLFDFAGIVLFFLSVSAFYVWYFPNKVKRYKRKKLNINVQQKAKPFRFFHKYHVKLGIWLALILLIIGGTGFFMRPPLLAIIANGSVPASMYPGILPENQWHKKVQNALYDPVEDKILISAADGIWEGPSDFSKPFVKEKLNAPIFVMGPSVFDAYGLGGYLIGSFNGIFHLERATGKPVNMINGKYINNWSNVRPGEFMVTGYFRTPEGQEFITSHEQGLVALDGSDPNRKQGRFVMPRPLRSEYKMPLWNVMFELHNGRIFKDLIGGFYILLVPLGSLMFILITLSGVYDWLFLKTLKLKIKNRNQTG